jgi:hypothetical protein
MAAVCFKDDDNSYLRWVSEHPDEYVVNMRRRLDPRYLVLHRADCKSITRYPFMKANPGGFTERGYLKLCGASISELKHSLKQITRRQDPFSKACSQCVPR